MSSAVSAALTEPDHRFDGISTAAIRREARRRRLASLSRDTRANPANVNGTYKTHEECAAGIERQILAYAGRIGADNDAAALAGLTRLAAAVNEATGAACRALVASGTWSWPEIAGYLGLGRQAAWDRYHSPDGNRRKRGTQLQARSRS